MPSDLQTITSDPEFARLSPADKATVIARVDPSFSTLSANDQAAVIAHVSGPSLSDQARARHTQLIRDNPGQIDPQTGMPTYAGTGVMDQIPQTPLGGLVEGAGRGALSTAYNLGEAVRSDPLLRATGIVKPNPDEQGPNDITAALQPQGGWQKAGNVAERMAEFMVPGASSTIKGAQGLGTLARMGIEGASGAAVGAAQGDNPIATGMMGAAGPLVAKGFQKIAPGLVNNLFGAGGGGIGDTGASAGAGITDNGIVAPWMGNLNQLSKEAQAAAATKGPVSSAFGSLLEKTLATKEAIGKRIGAIFLQNPAGTVPSIDAEQAFLGPLNDAIHDVTVAKDAPALERAKQLLYERFKDATASGSANSVSPAELWGVRHSVDSLIYGERASADKVLSDALQKVRTNFSDQIIKQVPEVAPLNQQYSDISQAVDSVVDTLKAGQNSNLLTKVKQVLQHPYSLIAGGGAYWLGGAPAVGAVIGARAGLGALGTAPIATGLAQGARALGSPAAGAAMGRVGAGLAGQVSAPSAQQPLTESIGSQFQMQPPPDQFGHDAAVSGLMSGAPTQPGLLNQHLQDATAVYVNPDGTGVEVPRSIMQQFIQGKLNGQ